MKPTHIIVHCSDTKDSGTVSWGAIKRWHVGRLGWSDIGYHFGCELIGDEFEILAGRPINKMGSHCKAGGMNHVALGFCLVGKFEDESPPEDQWEKSARYVAGLCYVLGIPVANIRGHREYDDHKTCPGSRFDMDKFRSLVDSYMKGG